MNFSKTTSYALAVLNFMAANDSTTYSAKDLHNQLDIPYPYLRQLLTSLSKHGLISGARGRSGGFTLDKNPSDIYIADIIDAVEGFEVQSICIIGMKECPFDHACAMHNNWIEARDNMVSILTNTSLASLRITSD